MKIILNSMSPQRQPADQQTYQLEVFLFKYLHFEKGLITQEMFQKSCGDSLKDCNFPVEFQVKLNCAYIQCLRTFLTGNKEVRFLTSLQQEHPQHYLQTVHYLKHLYYDMLRQLIKQLHTRQMKIKYARMAFTGRNLLADAGLPPYFGTQTGVKNGN